MPRSRSRSRERYRGSHSHRDRHSDRSRGDSHRGTHRGDTREPDRVRDNYDPSSSGREEDSRKRLAEPAQSEEEVKRQRLAKLAAWQQQQAGATVKPEQPSSPRPLRVFDDDPEEDDEEPLKQEAQSAACHPFIHLSIHTFISLKPVLCEDAVLTSFLYEELVPEDDVDPLDAFMDAAVNPEVAAAEKAEAARKEELRKEQVKALADGKKAAVPKLDELLAPDSDSEEEPDLELQLPANKVKYMVGQGGDKIKYIQRKTKCRIQVKKEQAELARAFGSGPQLLPPKGAPLPDGQKKMVTVMLFGSASECENARKLIEEACDNKEQKAKQRAKEYEKKKDEKRRDRQLYHMRHTHDYEELELPLGASKADVKKAFRMLAKKWHPDKHPENQEEAKTKFQAIQKAFESLMSTDEDARIEALTAAANEAHMP
ncbi:MAG: subfamily B member 6 [Trebouxia sp. A1-2]|nr:MAG: subfamily B member 6 [Trebouxia sp. A1-2]